MYLYIKNVPLLFTDGILLLISTSELISAFSDLQVLIVNIYIPLNF